MGSVPPERLRLLNEAPLRPRGSFVLYWMTAARRPGWNFALDRAVELARELDRPLVVLEPLRVDYRWASDRLHRFVLEGMADNARAFARSGVRYHPYVEPESGAGRGLVERLAEDACAVVGDDYPTFFLPSMAAAAAGRMHVRFESVDANGLWPMRATDRVFLRAVDFRRFLQRELPAHLERAPEADPLVTPLRPHRALSRDVLARWPAAPAELLAGRDAALARLPIDHNVPGVSYSGGANAGEAALKRFATEQLEGYGQGRDHPDEDASSGLSPYLHFGHLSAHRIFRAVVEREAWSPADLSATVRGQREGWWGLSPSAEGFLDQLVTWRELGFNRCANSRDAEEYASLPDWARDTLATHASDKRPYLYDVEAFDQARTHDDLWNAAQNQLRTEGRIHNYLRMLWGKKILHWSASPEEALDILIELNNRYAVDGRDPNSLSGIFWILGRYDRPWGPERPVFGKVRYMSGANTLRKLRVRDYLERWTD